MQQLHVKVVQTKVEVRMVATVEEMSVKESFHQKLVNFYRPYLCPICARSAGKIARQLRR